LATIGLPVGARTRSTCDRFAYIDHRGVRGYDVEDASGGGEAKRRIEGVIGLPQNGPRLHATDREAQREVVRAIAGADERGEVRCKAFEVGVVDPGDVLPILDAVVQHAEDVARIL